MRAATLDADLGEAIARRDFARCVDLLDHGADPNAIVESGDTALHLAVRTENARVAALLLARGADYGRPNAEGQRPLATPWIGLELLHRIRQEYQRLPLDPYRTHPPQGPHVAEVVRALDERGIVRVADLVGPAMLRTLQREFRVFIRRLWAQTTLRWLLRRHDDHHYDREEHWLRAARAYTTNNAFKYSTTLIALCRSPRVRAIVNHYLRKPGYVQRAQAMRYLPAPPAREHGQSTDQFQWHHDMEDKRLKMLVLLTDVAEDGQCMSYVVGSHVAYHPYERFLKNSLDLAYCRSYLETPEIYRTVGRTGDVFFFDSNGMHRGQRSMRATRDAYFVEFSADRNQNWGATISPRVLAGIEDAASDPLYRMRRVAVPKWQQAKSSSPRTVSTWVLSLENVASWV